MTYFEYIQARPGRYLNDPILERIPARNVSGYIFVVMYGSLLYAIYTLVNKPRLLVQAFQIYCLIISLRIVTLYLVPLEPSNDLILLEDPLLDYFIYKNKMISKDLFFSGHVATLCLTVLIVRGKWNKIVLGIATILMAILILAQHVHYSVDVVVAPIVTFFCYYMVNKFYEKYYEWFGKPS